MVNGVNGCRGLTALKRAAKAEEIGRVSAITRLQRGWDCHARGVARNTQSATNYLVQVQYSFLSKGRCANIPLLVDGGFSEWSHWSQCTRSCDGGTRTRARLCDSPQPEYGGANCSHHWIEKAECNVFRCPGEAFTYLYRSHF